MALSLDQVNQVLAGIVDPNTGKDLVSSRSARNVRVEGDTVSVDVELGYPAASQIEPVRRMVIDALKAAGAGNVSANVTMKIVAHAVQRGLKVMSNVKNIIAVASGKGGVGKSTVAANLALALAAEGARVGVLDADIYGPSQPTMLGISGQPESLDGQTLEPKENHGIQMSSIGLLVDMDQPMVWRGPMVTQALQQLLGQTNWKDLDYLVVDLPPGTSDAQLTLAQAVPIAGAVLVTTPQDVALSDVTKALAMFRRMNVPILGIVENMSAFACPHCGELTEIFGRGGAERLAKEEGLDHLGRIPLEMAVRQGGDAGIPAVAQREEGPAAVALKELAGQVAARLAVRAANETAPTLTVA